MAWWEGVDETRVLIAQGPSTSGKSAGTFLSLRHPRTGNTACYLYTDGGLQELHWFKQSYGSWFLGDYVCEDGRLYTATPVDPVFILLPVFEEAGMKVLRQFQFLAWMVSVKLIIIIGGPPQITTKAAKIFKQGLEAKTHLVQGLIQ